MDEYAPPSAESRASVMSALTTWLDTLRNNPVVVAIEPDPEAEADRWFVRIAGEAKDVYSVWLELGQRTLAYETYVMPAPEENYAAFYQQLLRRNDGLRELAFSIGEGDAIFLKGRIGLEAVDEGALDRIIGSIYVAVEQYFEPALRIGFASRFKS